MPSGLVTWKDGDFVLANDRVALVIEDVGDSDLYDPWGGRPVGLARVEDGKLVEPSNFGEFFVLTGRSTVVTEAVRVINDGSDGKPAIIRARGKLHPLPFFEPRSSILYSDEYADIEAAIDYELAPGSDHVDIRMRYASPRDTETRRPVDDARAHVHGAHAPGVPAGRRVRSDSCQRRAVHRTRRRRGDELGVRARRRHARQLAVGERLPRRVLPAATRCRRAARPSASTRSIIIGGPGLDGIQAAAARTIGDANSAITGTVTRDGVPAPGVHVHAIDGSVTYLTRATTDANGAFTLHVPASAERPPRGVHAAATARIADDGTGASRDDRISRRPARSMSSRRRTARRAGARPGPAADAFRRVAGALRRAGDRGRPRVRRVPGRPATSRCATPPGT